MPVTYWNCRLCLVGELIVDASNFSMASRVPWRPTGYAWRYMQHSRPNNKRSLNYWGRTSKVFIQFCLLTGVGGKRAIQNHDWSLQCFGPLFIMYILYGKIFYEIVKQSRDRNWEIAFSWQTTNDFCFRQRKRAGKCGKRTKTDHRCGDWDGKNPSLATILKQASDGLGKNCDKVVDVVTISNEHLSGADNVTKSKNSCCHNRNRKTEWNSRF